MIIFNNNNIQRSIINIKSKNIIFFKYKENRGTRKIN